MCKIWGEDAVFLQQAAHITEGIYMRPNDPRGLLQILMVGYDWPCLLQDEKKTECQSFNGCGAKYSFLIRVLVLLFTGYVCKELLIPARTRSSRFSCGVFLSQEDCWHWFRVLCVPLKYVSYLHSWCVGQQTFAGRDVVTNASFFDTIDTSDAIVFCSFSPVCSTCR